jgi:hypothetical protein
MGNCCLKCENTNKKMKTKAKKKKLLKKARRGGDNGDILNHMEALIHQTKEARNREPTRRPPDPIPISTDINNAFMSLHKSKKSIKLLEETIRNSHSIEKWLNRIEQVEQHKHVPTPQLTIKPTNPMSTKKASNDQQLFRKLFETKSKEIRVLKTLFDLNSDAKQIETEFKTYFENFLLPRSHSYSEDIDLLKWFFHSFDLTLSLPLACRQSHSQQHITSSNIKLISEQFYTFLLSSTDFNVKLCDTFSHPTVDLSDVRSVCESKSSNMFEQDMHSFCFDTPQLHTCKLDNEQSEQPSNHDLEFEYYRNLYDCVGDDAPSVCGRLRFLKKPNKKLNKKQQSLISSSSLHGHLNNSLKQSNRKSLDNFLDTNNNNNSNNENLYYLSYKQLNERLQTCLLGNFTRQIADQFMRNLKESTKTEHSFIENSTKTGFSYVSMNKTDPHRLKIDYFNFKFCIRLSEWPLNYESAFFKRPRKYDWPTSTTLETMKDDSCALTSDDGSFVWTVDYSYAQLELFNSLDDDRKFTCFLIWNFLKSFCYDYYNCTTSSQSSSTNTHTATNVNIESELAMLEKIFLNNFFLYVEMTDVVGFGASQNVLLVLKNFFEFFNELYTKNGHCLNNMNYFDFKLKILNDFPQSSFVDRNFADIIDKIRKKLEFQLKINSNNFFSTMADVNLYVYENCKVLGDLNKRSFAYHSKSTIIYEYLFDFMGEFRSVYSLKRESFQINEDVLIDLHRSFIGAYDKLVKLNMNVIDNDALLGNFEKYAQIVHTYLPQIRSQNQILLFHYIWTMHIQYLIPFVNYVIDLFFKNLADSETYPKMTEFKTITPPLSSSFNTSRSSSILSSTSSLFSAVSHTHK